MPEPIYPITHTVHGIHFSREGTCDRCKGHPKPLCNCDYQGNDPNFVGDDCPHLTRVANKNTCSIYDDRHLHCETCFPDEPGQTHQVCIDFPDHPWLNVIRDKVCGSYEFIRVHTDGTVDITPLPFAGA